MSSPGSEVSGSACVASARTRGWCSRSQVSAAGSRASIAVWKAATLIVPVTSRSEAPISASARSSSRSARSVRATRISACGVSRTPRPSRSSSGAPTSDSSSVSCWETAEGL
ncbi:hypothetical protein [Streptomyces sp. NPDC048172]|uniref:hypothetical protein n=1 Tax=Streptomyces sp. NPDC048172 TaxID=3365505 RepID=UPI003721ED25